MLNQTPRVCEETDLDLKAASADTAWLVLVWQWEGW